MNHVIKLIIKGISYSQTQTGAYALILEEEVGGRKLPIIIGSFEAQSIALALEKDITPPRPLTHDLFLSLGKEFQFNVKAVYIYKLEDGVFYSNIVFVDDKGQVAEIDSRTSDAIALAIRFSAPIYAYTEVVEKAGIHLEEIREEEESINQAIQQIEDEISTITADIDYSEWTDSELEEAMKKAVMEEDYEMAARYRDELDKRTN
ncbi:bifunctional nuclease domain-containing protein [Vaginella massiliensis]|uniref:bifunctional nuclease family protein n=1 Tax=Vaginella massiliensis TaxID=1816680 RepID=UPI0008399DE9|nr:bifunctional nuclease family protein [Vaginella massiliensis]